MASEPSERETSRSETTECRCDERRNWLLQPVLLRLIAEKPSHGYELVDGAQAYGLADGASDTATVYRYLRRLEQDGWVQSEWETGGNGPARRVYKLTSEGQELLLAWRTSLSRTREVLGRLIRELETHSAERR